MKTLRTLLILVCCVSCGGKPPLVNDGAEGLTSIVLQTDWYPQPEHGGFYHALLQGYYRNVGLDVTIRPGANVNGVYQLVATERVHFALGTSDNLLAAVARKLPLVGVVPYFQHDPQCIMVHSSSGVRRLQDLDGKAVMIQPSLNYVEYMRRSLGIRINVIPMDWSVARFVTNPDFVQQCFVTSEPYYVRQQGVEPRVLPLSESGFDPYRIVYTSRGFADTHPGIVTAFAAASLRGWEEFISADRSSTLAHIASLNAQHTPESMAWTVERMIEHRLVHGYPERGETLGRLDRIRLETQIGQLTSLEMLEQPIVPEQAFVFDLLPADSARLAKEQ